MIGFNRINMNGREARVGVVVTGRDRRGERRGRDEIVRSRHHQKVKKAKKKSKFNNNIKSTTCVSPPLSSWPLSPFCYL